MHHYGYALKQANHRDRPYVLDLQSELRREMGRRLVARLQRATRVNPTEIIDDLVPRMTTAGEDFIVFTQEATAYPARALAHAVADLSSPSSRWINALDRPIG